MRGARGLALAIAGSAAVALLPLVACNVLTGASDLGVCSADCDELGSPSRDEAGVPANDGSAGDGAPVLPPTCSGTEATCAGKIAAQCEGGAWKQTTCAELCVAGKCEPYPSCRNAAGGGCGTAPGASCCATANVPGGSFKRRNLVDYPATVSPFDLERFEVTVGRFRAFVEAGGATEATPPAAGAGAHPRVPNSGWVSAWNVFLPADIAALRASLVRTNPTWTHAPGANEHKPINNVSWFLAFAFCAWDGAHLPTFAEANFAASGGSEQRYYPWSNGPADTVISAARASYECNFDPPSRVCPPSSCSDGSSSPCNPVTCLAPAACTYPACTGCAFADIASVGALPLSAGKWGHFDLSGNVGELVLDDDQNGMPSGPCSDCATLAPNIVKGAGNKRLDAEFVVVGGGWDSSPGSLRTSTYGSTRDDNVDANIGFRCAR